jgi:hypothetical protein
MLVSGVRSTVGFARDREPVCAKTPGRSNRITPDRDGAGAV